MFLPLPTRCLVHQHRPPSAVIREDRAKATAVWTILLLGFIAYVIYLGLYSLESRENPPVKIQRKVSGIVFFLYCCLSCLALGIWNASTQLSTNMPTINHFDRSWWIAHTWLLYGAMFGGGSLPRSISVGVVERIGLCVSVTCSFFGAYEPIVFRRSLSSYQMWCSAQGPEMDATPTMEQIACRCRGGSLHSR